LLPHTSGGSERVHHTGAKQAEVEEEAAEQMALLACTRGSQRLDVSGISHTNAWQFLLATSFFAAK
jgi:hypothetical protein